MKLKILCRNFAMFEHISTKTEESETGIIDNQREEINNLLQTLESEIQSYFPEFSDKTLL